MTKKDTNTFTQGVKSLGNTKEPENFYPIGTIQALYSRLLWTSQRQVAWLELCKLKGALLIASTRGHY